MQQRKREEDVILVHGGLKRQWHNTIEVSSFVDRNANFHWKYYSTNLTVDLSEIVVTKSYYHAICADSTVIILKNGGLGTRPPIAQRNLKTFFRSTYPLVLIRLHRFRSTRSLFPVRLFHITRHRGVKHSNKNTCSGIFVVNPPSFDPGRCYSLFSFHGRKVFSFFEKKGGLLRCIST